MTNKVVKKKFKKSRGKKKPSAAKLPASSQEFSSNWQKISSQISKNETKKKGTRRKVPLEKKKDTKEDVSSKKKPEIWFDDVDMELLDPEDRPDEPEETTTQLVPDVGAKQGKSLVKDRSFEGLTKIIGIDCEMVGVGFNGTRSILARVSLVNHFGNTIYDKFVKPTEKVMDYRTDVSGIRAKDIVKGEDFKTVQEEVAAFIKDRILVGHSLKHDLSVLYLSHPKKHIRDTSTYKPFRKAFNGKTPSLKKLTAKFLAVSVQEGEHSPVEDARAAVKLYTMHRSDWEKSIKKDKSAKEPINVSTPAAATSKKSSCGDRRRAYKDSDSESED